MGLSPYFLYLVSKETCYKNGVFFMHQNSFQALATAEIHRGIDTDSTNIRMEFTSALRQS